MGFYKICVKNVCRWILIEKSVLLWGQNAFTLFIFRVNLSNIVVILAIQTLLTLFFSPLDAFGKSCMFYHIIGSITNYKTITAIYPVVLYRTIYCFHLNTSFH